MKRCAFCKHNLPDKMFGPHKTCEGCRKRRTIKRRLPVSARYFAEYQPTREEIEAQCAEFIARGVSTGRTNANVTLICPECEELYGTCSCLTDSCETPEPVLLPAMGAWSHRTPHEHRVLSRNARRLG